MLRNSGVATPDEGSSAATAAFDSRADAERAQQQLVRAGLDESDIHILEQPPNGESTNGDGPAREGLWAHIKQMFLPDEDRLAYEESMRRGGFVLTAAVEDDAADAAIETLESSNAVDMDARQTQWRAKGWSGDAEPSTAHTATEMTDQSASQSPGASEGAIPVVEERLSVGKREVNRGGVRVRSFIVAEPAQAEVNLRQERVDIERRPVNEPVRLESGSEPGDLMQERTLELSESSEEAVVAKDAVVTEEVRLSKQTDERVERIDDTVRRTEVEVEDTRSPKSKAAPKSSRPRTGDAE